MEKILLDTDIGGDIDDAVCLAYLLREPRCRLLGITTVCGQAQTRAAVADAICRAAGQEIPIAAGLDLPLQPIPVYPTPDGAGALENWPHATFPPADAAAWIYQKILENPHALTLVGIGSMTNIAVLLRDYPDAAGLLKGLCVMNGYFAPQPPAEPWENWNSWADPLASSLVFSASLPIRAVGLELTRTLSMDARQARRLFSPATPLLECVLDFGRSWLEQTGMFTLHDPLAAVSVFYPELFTFARGFVQVETHDPGAMGATRFIPDPHGNVEIATEVDRTRFYSVLQAALTQ